MKSTKFFYSCESVCHEVDASVSMKHSPCLKGDKRSLILSHIGMTMARLPPNSMSQCGNDYTSFYSHRTCHKSKHFSDTLVRHVDGSQKGRELLLYVLPDDVLSLRIVKEFGTST